MADFDAAVIKPYRLVSCLGDHGTLTSEDDLLRRMEQLINRGDSPPRRGDNSQCEA